MRPLPTALIAAALAGPAFAQPAPDAVAARMIARLDTDKNGTLSEAEWLAGGRKGRGFARMDTNHDGQLDKAELSAGIARKQARKAAKAAATPAPDSN